MQPDSNSSTNRTRRAAPVREARMPAACAAPRLSPLTSSTTPQRRNAPMTITRAGFALPRALETLAWASGLALGATAAQAQTLTEVVDAARGYDATYLGARSNLDAAHYRYEQQRALHLPSASITAQVQRQVVNTPFIPDPSSSTTDTGGATVNAQQTLFNRQNDL